ncbi:MAG: pitrilysin family protein [Desulfatirhabdiaceae bacterium]
MPEISAKKTVLDNGVRILTRDMPHVRSVSMGIWVNMGSRDESDTENGLSHFIEHMIFKGTEKRSAFDIARAFDAIGGYTNAFTSMENTCFHARVMDSHSETMIDILTDIFLNPAFSPENIERERPVILQEIGMVEDTPDEYVHMLAGETFWGGHPLGRSILGSRENIFRFDSDKLRQFFKTAYTPSRTLIAAAGHIDHDQLVDRIGPLFDRAVSEPTVDNVPPSLVQSRMDIHEKDLEQAHICISARGLAITDEKRYTLSMLNTLLGGNMSSRLFQSIREQRGLAYSVYSFVSSYSDAGMFGVYAGVDSANVSETINLILQELQRIKKEAPDLNDMKNAREFTKGSLLLSSESNDNQMVRLAQGEFYFGRSTSMDEIFSEIDSVTSTDIQNLAQELFQPDHVSLTLLGPVFDRSAIDGAFQVSD